MIVIVRVDQLKTMRTLLLALYLLPLTLLAQPVAPPSGKGIQWLSIEEAQAKTKKVPKPLFVDVYTQWCGPCKMLDRNTFSDGRLADFVNKNFYPVKFDAESGAAIMWNGKKLENPDFNPAQVGGRNGTHHLTHTIANANGRIAYPTVVYIDPDLNVLAPVQGYMTPQQMEPILTYFGEGHYKNQDYQAFMANFKAKW